MDRQRERLGRRQPVTEPAVHQQRPHVAEGDLLADQLLDVDAAVAQRAAVLVRFGDLGGEGHDAFQAGTKSSGTAVMRRFLHPRSSLCYRSVTSRRTLGRSVGAVATRDNEHLAGMRVEYGSAEKDGSPDLDVDWLADGWVALLRKWLADAERAGVAEPNAMVVGTVDEEGRPVTRSVLCKSVDETGITFFTNYDSAKGGNSPRRRMRRRRFRGSCWAARCTSVVR